MMYKILIIDDSDLARCILSDILSEYNVEIFEADDGKEGLNLYQDLLPDLVFLDITMPEMDGYKVLDKIIEFDSNAKVIIVSAIGQKTSIIKCFNSGAKAYITKPFEPEEIISKIDKFFQVPRKMQINSLC